MKALIGADLIDGTGGPVLKDAVVLLDGDRIESVGVRGSVARLYVLWPSLLPFSTDR